MSLNKILLVVILLLGYSCKQNNSTASTQVNPKSKSILLEKFAYTKSDTTIISVHRGGKGLKNYPENCLETIKYIKDSINAIFEIDIAQTKDSILVLMHDNSLDRTTTGTGKLTNYTYKELQNYNLVDDFGNITNYKIPTLTSVLEFAKTHNIVLTLDKKRSVDYSAIVKLIDQLQAQDQVVLITYDIKQATQAYQLAPNLLLSVSARNSNELDWLLNSKIPTQNMLAFTGTRLSSDSLYQAIHKIGVKTILGTLGNLDKQAQAKSDTLYKYWKSKGIDVIATDRPFEVAKALQN
ncbi:Glycerophosphoryl diester phosphodiesterase [Mesoflavibacter sp. HG96]|uniref:glycerophosphodiester phosphodiesterase family protein n=1 Tax=Mesoflavibacter TaxID=444051 RepID=UPI00140F1681|nr:MULTISPECIES: glycerophosphodiester phosphodiesterase family protein [Mesoflavibacter]QIJ87860.1 Glycerophosphoryl diester phosphodiesterase [Mesoflavibacter sp. HG96]QIJ90588.1 Glycerophosphoryl diester phosphodiesterase [Mesoflavibacter sp. HG37]